LPDNEIVVLQPIGSLFFAGAAEFEADLPAVGDAHGTAVIIRLRDRHEVGSTFIRTLDRYTRQLHERGNLLILVGLNEQVRKQLERTALLDLIGNENVFLAQTRFTAALELGLARARAWQAERTNGATVSG
jgi:SulP family sulfate permease